MDSEWRITFRMSASGLGSSRTNQFILLQLNNKDHQFLYVILSSYGSVGNAHMLLLSQLPDQNLFIAQPPGHTFREYLQETIVIFQLCFCHEI